MDSTKLQIIYWSVGHFRAHKLLVNVKQLCALYSSEKHFCARNARARKLADVAEGELLKVNFNFKK